jgi:hypothetical protein
MEPLDMEPGLAQSISLISGLRTADATGEGSFTGDPGRYVKKGSGNRHLFP